MGKRPDYACVVYGNLIRQTYKKTPVILGGIEASLRRMAHYDYWSDKLKRSILFRFRCGYSFLRNGRTLHHQIAEAMDAGIPVEEITYINGTVVKARIRQRLRCRSFPFEELKADRLTYARSFLYPVS